MKIKTIIAAAAAAAMTTGCSAELQLVSPSSMARSKVDRVVEAAGVGSCGGVYLRMTREGKGRGVQALPSSTARVDIIIEGSNLLNPIKIRVEEEDFGSAGAAEVRIDQIPVGTVAVKATVYDREGSPLGKGTAKVAIREGEVATAHLLLQMESKPAPTGTLGVVIDSIETPPAPEPVVVIPSDDGFVTVRKGGSL